MPDLSQRAEHAKHLLDDELLQEALARIETMCIEVFKRPDLDVEALQHAHLLLQMSRKFRAVFEGIIGEHVASLAKAAHAKIAALRP